MELVQCTGGLNVIVRFVITLESYTIVLYFNLLLYSRLLTDGISG